MKIKLTLFICLASLFFYTDNSLAQFSGNSLSVAVDNTSIDVKIENPGWEVTSSTSSTGGSSVTSANISDNEVAVMFIRFSDATGEGGRVTFDWKVSSEPIFDDLTFLILDRNDSIVLRESISGFEDWKRVGFNIPAGDHTLAWGYSKDVSDSAGSDRGWVDRIVIDQFGTDIPAKCLTRSSQLNSALDTDDLVFRGAANQGSSRFLCQTQIFTKDGSAAQSPPDAGQFTTEDLTTEVVGPIDIVFDWRVRAGLEDIFEIAIDFNEVDRITGSTPWEEYRLSVPRGLHTVRWRYRRFSSSQIELNSGFVDNLRLEPFSQRTKLTSIYDLILSD